jgi:hypothetical protein
LARIVDAPLLADLCRDSIVRLDRDPYTDQVLPSIEEVVYSPYPSRSDVRFECPDDGHLLYYLFRLLGCDPQAAGMPREGSKGLMILAHPEHIDPPLLAKAIGIRQPEGGDGPDEVWEDEDESVTEEGDSGGGEE